MEEILHQLRLVVYPFIPLFTTGFYLPRASVVTIGDGTIREEGGEDEVDFPFHVLLRWPKKKTADI